MYDWVSGSVRVRGRVRMRFPVRFPVRIRIRHIILYDGGTDFWREYFRLTI